LLGWSGGIEERGLIFTAEIEKQPFTTVKAERCSLAHTGTLSLSALTLGQTFSIIQV